MIFVIIFLVPSCTSYSITEKREIKPQAKPEPTPNNPKQPRAFGAAAQKRCVSYDDQKHVSSCKTRLQHEHIHEFQLPHEGVSEVNERFCERSKQASIAQ